MVVEYIVFPLQSLLRQMASEDAVAWPNTGMCSGVTREGYFSLAFLTRVLLGRGGGGGGGGGAG